MKFHAPSDEAVHIGLTSGHTAIVDPKAEPDGTELSDLFHKEAISRGCIPAGVIERVLQGKHKPFDRMEKITRELEAMVDGDDEDSFLANGNPNKVELDKRLGFTSERTEVEAAWLAILKRVDEAAATSKSADEAASKGSAEKEAAGKEEGKGAESDKAAVAAKKPAAKSKSKSSTKKK